MLLSFLSVVLPLAPIAATAQAPSQGQIVSRMASLYRSMQSFRLEWKLTRKVAGKSATSTVRLLASRPNLYLLEIAGAGTGTLVSSDGENLLRVRPERKAYTRGRAPALLMGGDILGKTDIPSPAARVVTLLLEGTLRTSDLPLARSLARAEVSPPQPFGEAEAHLVRFSYDRVRTARLTVTPFGLIRKAEVLRNGIPEIVEDLPEIGTEEKIPPALFKRSPPPGAILVASLPELPEPTAEADEMAPDFEALDVRGRGFRLSNYRGKVVILAFFQIAEEGPNAEIATLKRLDSSFRSQGLQLILIDAADTLEKVADWLAATQIGWPCTVDDEETDIASLYKVDSLPQFAIVDREGKLAGRVIGHRVNDTRIERILDKLGIRLN